MVKILGITQARVGSSRLPGKVLMTISGKSLLYYHLMRLSKSTMVSKWIVATTNESESKQIIEIADSLGISSFIGDLENVLNRFYEAAKCDFPDYVVRVTSDCPLVDPLVIDHLISYTLQNNLNYCMTSDSYPDGFDVEVFKFSELLEANNNATLISDKEHVTPYIKRKPINSLDINKFPCKGDFKQLRLTVDELSDFKTIEILLERLGPNHSWYVYADFIVNNYSLFTNQKIIRNEGYLKSILKNETS